MFFRTPFNPGTLRKLIEKETYVNHLRDRLKSLPTRLNLASSTAVTQAFLAIDAACGPIAAQFARLMLQNSPGL
jgi:hypothetical protein